MISDLLLQPRLGKPKTGALGNRAGDNAVTFGPTAVYNDGKLGNFEPVIKKGSGPGVFTYFYIGLARDFKFSMEY